MFKFVRRKHMYGELLRCSMNLIDDLLTVFYSPKGANHTLCIKHIHRALSKLSMEDGPSLNMKQSKVFKVMYPAEVMLSVKGKVTRINYKYPEVSTNFKIINSKMYDFFEFLSHFISKGFVPTEYQIREFLLNLKRHRTFNVTLKLPRSRLGQSNCDLNI